MTLDSTPHGRPTAAELVAAVREFLDTEVRPATAGSVAFHARVASNVLAMVERELQQDSADISTAALGVDTETELANRIRSGDLDDRIDDVVDTLDGLIRRRLSVAHPGYEEEP